jgi:hypothetical protein
MLGRENERSNANASSLPTSNCTHVRFVDRRITVIKNFFEGRRKMGSTVYHQLYFRMDETYNVVPTVAI